MGQMKMKRRRKMKHDIDLRSSLDLRKYLESSRGFGGSCDNAGRGNRHKRWPGPFIAETEGSKQV